MFSLFRNCEQPGTTSCDPHWHKWFLFSMSVWTHRDNRVLLTVPTVQQLNCVHSVLTARRSLIVTAIHTVQLQGQWHHDVGATKETNQTKTEHNKNIYSIQKRWFYKKNPARHFQPYKDNLTSLRLYILPTLAGDTRLFGLQLMRGRYTATVFVCFFLERCWLTDCRSFNTSYQQEFQWSPASSVSVLCYTSLNKLHFSKVKANPRVVLCCCCSIVTLNTSYMTKTTGVMNTWQGLRSAMRCRWV